MWNAKVTGHPVPVLTDKAAVPGDSVMRFDAATAVRGIVFHLVDEGLARSIAADTIRRTLDRLTSRCFNSGIPRTQWRRMSHAQRLDWLLTESQTLTLMGDNETVFLRARRVR